MEVRLCRVDEIFARAELLAEYEAECANPELGACVPQREVYERLEEFGNGLFVGGYVDGVLRGFASAVIGPLPHHPGVFAIVESVFAASAVRRTGLGNELMAAIEGYARDAKCGWIFYLAPVGSQLARLLFLQGDLYTNTGHTFCRRLAA